MIKRSLKCIFLFTLILGICIVVGGVLFSVEHSKVESVDLKTYSKELIILEDYVKKNLS